MRLVAREPPVVLVRLGQLELLERLGQLGLLERLGQLGLLERLEQLGLLAHLGQQARLVPEHRGQHCLQPDPHHTYHKPQHPACCNDHILGR